MSKREDKAISSFAYETAINIEEFIKENTDNLVEANRTLEAKILGWYVNHGKDKEFAKHFGIETNRGNDSKQ